VVVEAHETTTIKAFQEWGFKVVPVPFRNFLPFGKHLCIALSMLFAWFL
jgi:hypothetical protein